MSDYSSEKRLRDARRLKAARYLRGTVSKGRRQEIVGIPIEELAEHPVLKANNITANQIREIEQMQIDARPMVLEKIAQALEIPAAFLVEDEDVLSVQQQLSWIAEAIRELTTEVRSAMIVQAMAEHEGVPDAGSGPPSQTPPHTAGPPGPSPRGGSLGSVPLGEPLGEAPRGRRSARRRQ